MIDEESDDVTAALVLAEEYDRVLGILALAALTVVLSIPAGMAILLIAC